MPSDSVEVRRWCEKAGNDRRTAEAALALDPPITDVAAFHCLQAVEKLLKAYLVAQRHEFEKIHDLRVLANLCAEHDPAFTALRDRVAPLTTFAVRFRYPTPTDRSIAQVQGALAVVGEVWDFVADRLPPDARPYLVMVDLETLPENAMICSSWATSCPLWYAQHVLGQRPDVDVINALPGNWPQFIAPNLDRPLFTTTNPGRLEEYTVTPYRVFWRVEPAITKPWMVVPNANTTILPDDVLVLVGSNESLSNLPGE